MIDRVNLGGLQVAEVLHRFVRDEALPGSEDQNVDIGLACGLREGPDRQGPVGNAR
jgi:hypothetical protein